MWGADLLRVGPLRRLDPRLLPHSLHTSHLTKGSNEAVTELQAMLKQATNPSDTAGIQAELEQVAANISWDLCHAAIPQAKYSSSCRARCRCTDMQCSQTYMFMGYMCVFVRARARVCLPVR